MANAVTFEELQKSGDLFADALTRMRPLVHKLCGVTKAHDECPYLREHGTADSTVCETCPMRAAASAGKSKK